MPWSFRKSLRLGSACMTVSKSGVSVSAGVPGLRLIAGPRGTHVTIGAGGVRYRYRIGDNSRPGALPVSPGAATGFPSNLGSTTVSPAGDAANLVDASSVEILDRLNACITAPVHTRRVLFTGLLLAWLCGLVWNWLFYLVGTVTLVGAYFTHRRDVEQRIFPLFYSLDAASANDWQELVNGLACLSQSQRLWRVDSRSDVFDWKRNAGASQLLNRHGARLRPEHPPYIDSNLCPFCLTAGAQQLFFFPDRVYVYQGGWYGCVDYDTFTLYSGSSQFIEREGVPHDAQVVDYTWRYVNKDGGPDRRFNDNIELPIALYGEVALESTQGFCLFLQVSSLHAAEASIAPLQNAIGRVHSHYAASRRLPAMSPPSAVALAHNSPRKRERFLAGPGSVGVLVYCVLALFFFSRLVHHSPARTPPIAQTAPAPVAPEPTLAPVESTAGQTSGTYDSQTQFANEPPPYLTKSQRAQWWVEHNREMRRRAAEAEQAGGIEPRNTRAQLEALDLQRRQREQVERTGGGPAVPPSFRADLPPPSIVLPERADSSGSPTATVPGFPPPAIGGFGGGMPPPASDNLGFRGPSSGPVSVRGYYRSDGTYVRPHTRGRGQ